MKNKKLLKMLVERELNKTQLAELTEVSVRQVRRIVNGYSSGSLAWWRKAAEVLNCTVAEIIED
jgi:DNA-binding Xre family transcriptional regulator